MSLDVLCLTTIEPGARQATPPAPKAAVGSHPTDRKILDAFHDLIARGVKVTDPRLSEVSGVSRRTVKKRRLRMIHAGRWPGKARQGKFSPEVVQAIKAQAAMRPRPTYAAIAEAVEAEFGRPINPKTVERILARPATEWIRAVQEAVRAEARREFLTRHDATPQRGISVWQVLKSVPKVDTQGPSAPTVAGADSLRGGCASC